MVTVTMEQIVDFKNGVEFLGEAQLPLKAAYKINKLRKNIDTEFEYYGEKFREIVNTYAKKDAKGNVSFNEDGSQILIQDDMIDECNKALVDLQSLEVEIDNCNLTINDFGEDLQCTPDELEALMPFLS